MLTLALPLPPSLNNAFATVTIKGKQRRIISRDYKAWKIAAGKVVADQLAVLGRWPAVKKHYALHYRFNLDHKSDIGNREKCATDLLVAMKIVPGDQWCDKLLIERDRTIEGAIVTVGAL